MVLIIMIGVHLPKFEWSIGKCTGIQLGELREALQHNPL